MRTAVWTFILLLCMTSLVRAQDTSALLNEALDKQVRLDLDATLPRTMDIIAEQTGVRIEAQRAVWDLLPWGQQTNIKARIENQTLRQALMAITRKLGLQFEVKDEVVELQPLPALRRVGRRATPEELAALDLLSSHPLEMNTDRPTLKQLLTAIDQKLENLKSPYAVENRAFNLANEQGVPFESGTLYLARNATLLEALEVIPANTRATWYPWGNSLVIVPKEDQVRAQLEKTISVRYEGVDLAQVLLELSQRAGIPFDIEPGAVQRVPADARNVSLFLDNASIRQALEALAGFTGLAYVVTDRGVYISNPSTTTGAPRDRIVGIITIPDLNIQVLVPQSQVSPELAEYLKYKTQKELENLRKMMEEEGFQPTTQPKEDNAN